MGYTTIGLIQFDKEQNNFIFFVFVQTNKELFSNLFISPVKLIQNHLFQCYDKYLVNCQTIIFNFDCYFGPCFEQHKDITSGAGIGSPPGAPEFTFSFSVVCVAQSVDFLYSDLQIIVFWAIIWSVLRQFTISDYSFGIFNLLIDK